jgi:hypothetical protein
MQSKAFATYKQFHITLFGLKKELTKLGIYLPYVKVKKMQFINFLQILFIGQFLTLSLSFETTRKMKMRNSDFPTRLFCYQAKLQEGKMLRQLKKSNPSASIAKPDLKADTLVLQPKSEASSALPFDDEIYEHLKFVISKLTAKIKHDQSLSHVELEKFRDSIVKIMADANISCKYVFSSSFFSFFFFFLMPSFIPPVKVADLTEKQRTQVLQNDGVNPAFSSFVGQQSTWRIDGMEDMTTEEYYKVTACQLQYLLWLIYRISYTYF